MLSLRVSWQEVNLGPIADVFVNEVFKKAPFGSKIALSRWSLLGDKIPYGFLGFNGNAHFDFRWLEKVSRVDADTFFNRHEVPVHEDHRHIYLLNTTIDVSGTTYVFEKAKVPVGVGRLETIKYVIRRGRAAVVDNLSVIDLNSDLHRKVLKVLLTRALYYMLPVPHPKRTCLSETCILRNPGHLGPKSAGYFDELSFYKLADDTLCNNCHSDLKKFLGQIKWM